jgi:hypothetical protein
MSPIVNFIDTSILCNLIPVPGRDQQRKEVIAEFQSKIADNQTFILPITTVVETGNHIRHVTDGRQRRDCAGKFADLLQRTISRTAPWALHEITWDAGFLTSLIEGAETKMSFVDHAVSGLGCGDLCIICERNAYARRTSPDERGHLDDRRPAVESHMKS